MLKTADIMHTCNDKDMMLIILALVEFISCVGLYCHLIWWPPLGDVAAILNLIIYFTLNALIIYYHVKAMLVGAGYIPLQWLPVS